MKLLLTLLATALLMAGHAQNSPEKISLYYDELNDPQIIPAQFPGGSGEWMKYVRTSLSDSIADNISLKKGQKDSTQTVIISFFIDTTGSIVDIKVENPNFVHPKVAADVARVMKNAPKWIPARIQNGLPIIYKQRQTISFWVTRS